jgi:DNA-directed RNA polymerase I, II, and III subunit RPABC2
MSDTDSDDEYVPPPPPPVGSKKARDDSDSDDDYVPPPPPAESKNDDDTSIGTVDGNDDDDDDDDNDSLADSESDFHNISQAAPTKGLGESMQYMNEAVDNLSDDDDDDGDENYLQKFDEDLKTNTISAFHPELLHHNNEEVDALSRVVRNEQGMISDPLHQTFPFITKYERARILGERAKQLNMGAKPLVEVGPDVIDGYLIALAEYEQKRIPFIIKRPLPNGGCEYWKFKDLETI